MNPRTRLAVILILTLTWQGRPPCAADREAGSKETVTGSICVAPGGDDANPGTQARPVASPQRALALARAAGKAGAVPVTVILRGGTYYLDRPLVFTPEDSGSADAPVTWRAAGGEAPVLSGGARLDLTWTVYKDGILQAEVSAVRSGRPAFDQLFLNGKRQILARYPNYDPNERHYHGYSPDADSPARARRWADPAGGYVHALHQNLWGGYHFLITGKDQDGSLQVRGVYGQTNTRGTHPKYRFVENIFEELDAPGEWYLDRAQGILYCMPPAGVDLATARVEVAGIRHLIEVRGSRDRPVRHLTFQGLTFTHTARTFMDTNERLTRSDWSIYRGGAVVMEGTEDCTVQDCFFDAVGGNALFADSYNRRVTVRGNKVAEACANAFCFVGADSARFPYGAEPGAAVSLTPGPATPDYPGQCLVEDNLVRDIGLVEKQVAGVEINLAEEITVRHNTICGLPRAGINIGIGCFGGHLIEDNDVFDTVRETGDHGPFNSWGRDRQWRAGSEAQGRERALLDNCKTTFIRHNRFAHGNVGHSFGIDLDDGSSNYQIQDNLTLGCSWKLREGFFRVVENNICLGVFPPGKHACYDRNDDVIRHNIYVSTLDGCIHEFIRGKPRDIQTLDYNLYWNSLEIEPHVRLLSTRPEGFKEKMTLMEWQAQGLDTHSLFADPQFVDPGRDDYRVGPDSPALRLGFRNFRMDNFGVRKAALQAEAKAAWQAFRPQVMHQAPSTGGSEKKAGTWLGASVRPLTGINEASAYGVSADVGMLVVAVPVNSEAAKVGLQSNDLIVEVNGQAIGSLAALETALRRAGGYTAPCKVRRPPQGSIVTLPIRP